MRKVLESGSQALPVYEGNEIVGILSRSDFLNLVEEFDIHSIMKSPVFTVSQEDSSAKAVEIMKEKRISKVAVVKDEGLVGFVTAVSLLKVYSQEFHGKKPKVSLIMERVEDVNDDPSFEEIMKSLKEHGVFYFTTGRVPYAVVAAVDVLEHFLVRKEELPIEVIGTKDPAVRAELEKFGSKIRKMVRIFGIVLHVKQVKEEYEIKLRLYTNIGNFNYSGTYGNLLSGVNEATDEMEEMVKAKKSKIRDLRRRIYIE